VKATATTVQIATGARLWGAHHNQRLVNQALSFNGSSAFVQVPDAANLRFTTNITFEGWIYPRAVGGRYREILSKWRRFRAAQFYYNHRAKRPGFISGK